MALPELDVIIKEVESKYNNDEKLESLKKNIKYLYDHCSGESINTNKDKIIKNILNNIFPNVKDVIMLPYEFLNTNLYKLIATAQLGINQNEIYTNEVMKLSGYGRVYILDEVRRGNLKAQKKGNRWIFYQDDVFTWLEKKNTKKIHE